MNSAEIAKRIKQVMADMNLTTQQFADLTGTQRSSLSHVFNGRNKPSLELIDRIVQNVPDVSYEYLISGKQTASEQIQKETPSSDQDTKVTNDAVPEKQSDTNVTKADSDKSADEEPVFSDSEDPAPYESPGGVSPDRTNNPSKPNNKVVRVVLLYSDGTFEQYTP